MIQDANLEFRQLRIANSDLVKRAAGRGSPGAAGCKQLLVLRVERRIRHRRGWLPLVVHHFKTKLVDLAAGTHAQGLPNGLQVAVEHQGCGKQLRMRRRQTNPNKDWLFCLNPT